MAAEFSGQVQPVKPVSEEVGRPTNAPNYAGMFSEAIRGALAPYQYILDYKKSMSEDAYHQAQIQNFLDEHDIKVQELQEQNREHVAGEAQKKLEYQLGVSKQLEDVRHNKADEADKDLTAHLNAQRLQADLDREHAEQRRADTEDQVKIMAQQQHEQEEKRKDMEEERNQKLRDAQISIQNAQQQYHLAQLEKDHQDNLDREHDAMVLRDLQGVVRDANPRQIWGMDEDQDLRKKITDLHNSFKTDLGRRQGEQLISGQSEIGREMTDRDEYYKMSPEAKTVFRHIINNENPDPSDARYQKDADWDKKSDTEKFSIAFTAAQKEQKRRDQMEQWSPAARESYELLHRSGKHSELEAYSAGEAQHNRDLQDLKARETAPKEMTGKDIGELSATFPKGPNETDEDYFNRLINMWNTSRVQKAQPGEVQPAKTPPPPPKQSPTDYINKIKGTSMLLPSETGATPPTQSPFNQLALATSGPMPGTNPDEFEDQYRDTFGESSALA
jgi:hypothetical protein